MKTNLIPKLIGFLAIFGIWSIITSIGLVPAGILPSPIKIVKSLKELLNEGVIFHTIYSLKLNWLGLFEAVLITIPIGFIIGLVPTFYIALKPYTEASRFLPLTGVVPLFIVWFGIGDMMKIQFLALSIVLYLLPELINRLNEVDKVYVQTARTLDITEWQLVRKIYWPAVKDKLFNNIIVQAALSWTYIIVAELVNTQGGGIGTLINQSARQSRLDKVFALLCLIMLIGYLQDRFLNYVGTILFPYSINFTTQKSE